jgi:hypothetical protein
MKNWIAVSLALPMFLLWRVPMSAITMVAQLSR